jgi:hypothetical protein
MSQAMMNGTHRPEHKVGKTMMKAGMAVTAPLTVKTAVSKLCSIRQKTPGNPYPNAIPSIHHFP